MRTNLFFAPPRLCDRDALQCKMINHFSKGPVAQLFMPVLLLLLFLGCGASSQLSRPADPQTLYLQIAENYRRLNSFHGKGRLIVDSPQMQLMAPAKILARHPDSLFIKVEAVFGVDVGFFFADRKRFECYSPFENTFFYGNTGQLDRLLLFEVELTYDEIMSGIIGAALPPLDSTFTMRPDDGAYRFEGWRPPWRLSYWVDAERRVVTKAEQHDSTGALYSRQTFRRFRKIKGVWLPQWLQLDKPGQRERFTIYYDRTEINTSLASSDFRVRVPASAARVNLSGSLHQDEMSHPQ